MGTLRSDPFERPSNPMADCFDRPQDPSLVSDDDASVRSVSEADIASVSSGRFDIPERPCNPVADHLDRPTEIYPSTTTLADLERSSSRVSEDPAWHSASGAADLADYELDDGVEYFTQPSLSTLPTDSTVTDSSLAELLTGRKFRSNFPPPISPVPRYTSIKIPRIRAHISPVPYSDVFRPRCRPRQPPPPPREPSFATTCQTSAWSSVLAGTPGQSEPSELSYIDPRQLFRIFSPLGAAYR